MNNFKNFKVHNGFCIEYAEMPLENQGFVLIEGVNKDEGGSNGAGKSSLFDLLASTITGKTGKYAGSKNANKNDLLNLKNPKNLHTQLIFEKNNSEYLVNSYRAHEQEGTRIEIIRDGENITPTTKLDDVQKEVLKILGYLPDEVFGQIYLCQQYTHALVQGTPSQKKKYLSMYFGLEDINLTCSIVQKTINGIQIPNEAELEDLRNSAEQQIKDLPSIDELVNNKNTKIQEKDFLQNRAIQLKFEIEQQTKAKLVEEQSKEWQLKLAKIGIAFSVEELKAKELEFSNNLNSYKKELSTIIEIGKLEHSINQKGIKTDQSYQELREKISSYEKLIEEYKEKTRSLEIKETKQKQLANIPKIEDNLKTLSLSLMNLQTETDLYTKTLNTLASEIQKLSFKGTSCPTCLRPITEEEHKEMLQTRQHGHSTLDNVIKELKLKLEDTKNKISNKEKEMILNQEISLLPEGELLSTKLELTKFIETKVELQTLADNLVQISELQTKLQYLKEQRNLDIDISDIDNKIQEFELIYSTVKIAKDWLLVNGQAKFDMNKLSLAQDEANIVNSKLNKITEEIVQLSTNLSLRQQLEKQINDINKIISKNNEERNRRRILEVINVTANNIKKTKMKEATEVLTQILPFYIKQLFPKGDVSIYSPDDGKEFDLFLNKGNQQIPLYLVSGGQGKRVALSIFFAFAKMGAKSSNIIMLDEPYRDLDINGREACYEILQDLNIPSIFITSHDIDQKNTKKYNQVWTVEMENDISRLIR